MRFLFVDRIVQSVPGRLVKGIKQVTTQDAFLSTDDQGKTCFISSLIGETLGQLAAWNVMHHHGFNLRPVAGVVASAQLHRPAYLGETILLESFIDHLDDQVVEYHSVAHVNNERVFTLEGALGPLLPMADFIDKQVVEQQYNALYHSEHTLAGEVKTLDVALMQFDNILASEAGVSLAAEKYIAPTAGYFPDHFPNKPVLPLTVLLECKLNLAKEFIARAGFSSRYQVSEFRKIKMSDFVHPGDTITTYLNVKAQMNNQLVLSFRSEVASKRVCVVEVVCQKVT